MKNFSIVFLLLMAGGPLFGPAPSKAATPDGKGFPTADAAARALVSAARTDNVPELIQILGPSGRRSFPLGIRWPIASPPHLRGTRCPENAPGPLSRQTE